MEKPIIFYEVRPQLNRSTDVDGAERGVLRPNAAVMLNGVNLWREGDAGTKVAFHEIDGTGVTLTPAPEQSIEPDTDVEFKYTVTNGDGDSEELTLTIPTLVVE